MRGIKLGEGSG